MRVLLRPFTVFAMKMTNTVNLPKSHGGAAPPAVIRGFSGHWMAFYAAAFALLYSRVHAPEFHRERRCPQGHPVSPTAGYCPACGLAVPAPIQGPNPAG